MIKNGTSLIVLAVKEGVVMAADDLVYRLEGGVAVPAESNVRKVFAMRGILIGTVAMLRCKDSQQISAGGEATQAVAIEYKSEDWIIEFIRAHRGAPDNTPESIAAALYTKMRETFKPVEILLEHGRWGDQTHGKRLVTYVVAGYSKSFKDFHLFDLGAEYNAEENGLKYVAPLRCHSQFPHEFYVGEDEFLTRAARGAEPQAGVFRDFVQKLRGTAGGVVPNVPKSLQELVTLGVSLVKVEAQFNPNKVGRAVNAAIIDRMAKKCTLATF